jgi:O-antigen/teichoic acid export membrane protein
LVLHAGTGFVAFLLALLSQSWFAIFLAAGPWVAGGIARGVPSERRDLRKQVLVLVALSGFAVATAMAVFVTGLFVYARDMGPFWHGTLALSTVILQCAAIVAGLRGVASMESQLRHLEQTAPDRQRA